MLPPIAMWPFRQSELNPDHIAAHKHCFRHRAELEASELCGCFYCIRIFPFSEIKEWIDDAQTALCPKCEIDSVIGSRSGYPISRAFLERMHDYWF
jgi:hypothetical protein